MEARSEEGGAEERSFINTLYSFMKERGTPIERIPHLGFKQINLWKIYQAVETLGGYEAVTSRRLWKNVYDELGGSPGSTSAATCTRRHYERLVLPYERQLRGEEDKPLPLSKPRKQYKRCPESKGSQTENQKKRQMEKEESEVHLDSEQTGTLSHHSPWSSFSDRTDSDHQSTVPRSGTRSSSGPSDQPLQTSQAEVISPLEKKKRLAQACLSAPTSCTKEDVGELERPSVIQLSHTHQTPACSSSTRTRHTSDGSPLPLSSPSGSFSRSPSPYSVSSEDCIAVSSQKTPDREVGASRPTLPTSESRNTRICKPVSCYASTREPASYPHLQYQKFFPAGQPHPNKNQRNIPQWTLDGMFRDTFLRLGSHNTKTCWVPAASSFTKVLPRDPCRSTFKPHLSYQQQQQLLKRPTTTEAFGPKMSSASPLSVTDRKEKAKALVTKSHLTQQYLWNPHNNQALPYIPHLETTRGDLPGQLKPPSLQPVLLPAHLTVPPGQTHPIHCPPMECSYLGQFEAAPPTWPCYSYPLWHPPAGYTMTGLQPY